MADSTAVITCPAVPAVLVGDRLVVECPWCGREHTHGAGSGAIPAFGPRVAHCDGGQGYRLVPPDQCCGPLGRAGCEHTCVPDGVCSYWCGPCQRGNNEVVQAARLDRELRKSTMTTAVMIGLRESRRTLDKLRAGVDRHPETAGLVAAWEDAINLLEEIVGPQQPSMRREASDG